MSNTNETGTAAARTTTVRKFTTRGGAVIMVTRNDDAVTIIDNPYTPGTSARVSVPSEIAGAVAGFMADQGPPPAPEPVPMILWCPLCNERHIDEGKFANRPHHTHACQSCGVVWRPAVVDTVGVRFLPGFGPERP